MNIKRMENMIEELNESFEKHLAENVNTYYYIMQQNGAIAEFAVRIYCAGKAECEVILMPDYSKAGEINCQIKVDGNIVETRTGIITIADIDMKKGYHTLEFVTSDNVACARVRLSGALSNSSILSI